MSIRTWLRSLFVAVAIKEGNKFVIEGEEFFAMKAIAIETEKRPPADWLPRSNNELVYLTEAGRPRYVIVPLDEGDQEVLAAQKNERLMAYVAESVKRGRKGPTKSLAQVKNEMGLEK